MYDWLSAEIDQALRRRLAAPADQDHGPYVELLSDIYDDLRDSKFVSQTKGKGIFLLSTHTKARREYKKRRIHEISKEPGQFYADS